MPQHDGSRPCAALSGQQSGSSFGGAPEDMTPGGGRERLLKRNLLVALYSMRSERRFCADPRDALGGRAARVRCESCRGPRRAGNRGRAGGRLWLPAAPAYHAARRDGARALGIGRSDGPQCGPRGEQRVHKRIEEVFGRLKTAGGTSGQRAIHHRLRGERLDERDPVSGAGARSEPRGRRRAQRRRGFQARRETGRNSTAMPGTEPYSAPFHHPTQQAKARASRGCPAGTTRWGVPGRAPARAPSGGPPRPPRRTAGPGCRCSGRG